MASRPQKPGRSIEDESDDALDDDEDRIQQWRISTGTLNQTLHDIYWPNVLSVILTIPHLERLSWAQPEWNQTLLSNLTACTIRHLSLHDAKMTDIVPIMDNSIVWPLETLDIGLSWDRICRIPRWTQSKRFKCLEQFTSIMLGISQEINPMPSRF